MNRKTKFKIIWAIYCILILPFVLITIIADLFDGVINFCAFYVEEVKYWIVTKYKPND